MFKSGIILLICHLLIDESSGQVVVEKQNPYLLLKSRIRAVAQEPITMRIKRHDIPTKEYDLQSQDILSDKQLGSTHSQIIQKAGLPLVKLGNSFYYFGTYFTANFFKAMGFCKDNGMELLSIDSNEENTRIFNFLSTRVSKIEHFWTSGSDLGEEGQYVWLATGKPFNFTYWVNQPDGGTTENCLELKKSATNFYVWNDLPCSNANNFICEVEGCSEFCMN